MKFFTFAAILLSEVVHGADINFLRSNDNSIISSETNTDSNLEDSACKVLEGDLLKGDIDDEERRKELFSYFKPCGYYEKTCKHHNFEIIPANVDYPGSGTHDISNGERMIVQFDIGIDVKLRKKVFDGLKYPIVQKNCIGCQWNDWKLPGDIDKSASGETCIEAIVKIGTNLGNYLGFKGGCLGKCGTGCDWIGGGMGKDCAKHDLCSYYKLIITKQKYHHKEVFCFDPDCGDEAAQAVLNCFKASWFLDPVKVCHESEFDKNPSYYGHWSLGSYLVQGNCGNFVGWDNHQGLPDKSRISNPYKMLEDGRMVPIDYEVDEDEVNSEA